MKILYALDFTSPQQKYLRVSCDLFRGPEERGELTLVFPVWTPGSYLVREFAANVEDFAVFTPSGRALAWEKLDKCRWRVRAGKADRVRLTYGLYAGDPSVRSVTLDHEFAFANAPAVYFHPEGLLDTPVTLRLKLPPGWRAELAKPSRGGVYAFADFDELYDTPILASGGLETRRFRAGRTAYRFAFFGAHDGDLDRLCSDAVQIARRQAVIFGGNPCREYLFQVMFLKGGYGGLEHRACSSNIFDGFALEDPKRYREFVSLLAHEHFHLWNVKRIRPRELGPFDYTRENYTRELWIAEGVTSYYDDHTAYRAGVYSRATYLDVVAENIEKLEKDKACLVNSLADASFDAWIRFYRPNENTPNRTLSYYLKGGLVMMLLDFRLIRETSGRKNLDHLMRALYRIYRRRPGTGITREEFFAAAEEISGVRLDGFVGDYVTGVKSPPWGAEFEPFGLEFRAADRKRVRDIGVTARESGGKVLIEKVREDSPAFASPLQCGDEIIAVNGRRVDSPERIKQALTAKPAEIIFSRRGLVHRTRVNAVAVPESPRRLAVAKSRSPAQRRLLEVFLRR